MRLFLLRLLCLSVVAALGLAGCKSAGPAGPDPTPVAQPTVEPEPVALSVYFATKDLGGLEAEARDALSSMDTQALAESAVTELLKGPAEDGHVRLIPAKTKLLRVTAESGIATVDLSESFVKDFQGGSDIANLTVYSLVNTVAGVKGIDHVRITVGGKPISEYGGVLSLAEPLAPDLTLAAGEPLSGMEVKEAPPKP